MSASKTGIIVSSLCSILSINFAPDIVPGAEDTAIRKMKSLLLGGLHSSGEKMDIKQTNKIMSGKSVKGKTQ